MVAGFREAFLFRTVSLWQVASLFYNTDFGPGDGQACVCVCIDTYIYIYIYIPKGPKYLYSRM